MVFLSDNSNKLKKQHLSTFFYSYFKPTRILNKNGSGIIKQEVYHTNSTEKAIISVIYGKLLLGQI